jgi:chromosomal replication initiator protein
MIKELISPYSFPGIKKENLDKEKYWYLFPDDYKPTKEEVLKVLSEQSGISAEQIVSKSRNRNLVNLRNIYCKILYDKTDYTLKAIGEQLSGRDHTTVLNNIGNFDSHYKNEEDFKKFVDKVCKKLKIEL